MQEEFITYLNRDARVLKVIHYPRFDAMLLESMGEPFYTEYAAADDSTRGRYEQITWAYFPKPASVTIDVVPDDLPIPADPREDEVLDGERLGDAAWYRQVNDLQRVGRGA